MANAWLCLLAVGALAGEPLEFSGIFPPGGKAGTTVRVVVAGTGIDDFTELFAPDIGISARVATSDSRTQARAGRFEFSLTINADAVPGVHPIWLRSNRGLSNPRVFAVDRLVDVRESRVRDSEPQAVSIPSAINGTVGSTAVDTYRFIGRAGQKIGIDIWAERIGSGLDPRIALVGPKGHLLADADDVPGLGSDCRLVAALPDDGTYTLQVHDSTFQCDKDQPYRLRLGAAFAEEIFPSGQRVGHATSFSLRGGTFTKDRRFQHVESGHAGSLVPLVVDGRSIGLIAIGTLAESNEPEAIATHVGPLHPPILVNGRISAPGEVDRYQIDVVPGERIVVQIAAAEFGSRLDPYLTVFTDDGKQLAEADDTFVLEKTDRRKNKIGFRLPDPTTTVKVPTNGKQIEIRVSDRSGFGGIGYTYRLRVQRAADWFDLRAVGTEVIVPRGGVGVVEVSADRTGFGGPILLSASGLPTGLTANPQVIPAGAKKGYFTLAADPGAMNPPGLIQIHGVAMRDAAQAMRRFVTADVRFTQDNTRSHAVPRIFHFDRFAVALTAPQPIRICVDADESVLLSKGTSISMPILVETRADSQGLSEFSFEAMALPKGITAAFRSPRDSTASVTLSAANDAADGPFSFIVRAKAAPGRDLVIAAASAVTVKVTDRD